MPSHPFPRLVSLSLLAAVASAGFLRAQEPAPPAQKPSAFAIAAPMKPGPMTPGGKWKPHDMNRPRPRVITPPGMSTPEAPGQPPSDATVLFDGKDLAKWKQDKKKGAPEAPNDDARWKVENGYFEVVPGTGYMRTREQFPGDTQWHLEWETPVEATGTGQGRGNSGVFIGGYPEVQVLDSYGNDTYPDGQAAGLYGFYPPMVNACRPQGEWQTYDIIAERERKGPDGKVIQKARLSVIQNGIVVQWCREIDNPAQGGDLALQDHGHRVRYRNIWVRPLNLTDPDSEGTPPPPAPAK